MKKAICLASLLLAGAACARDIAVFAKGDYLVVAAPNATGRLAATFAIRLPAGPYGVRFYVKDTDDFKIALYHDCFKFVVR